MNIIPITTHVGSIGTPTNNTNNQNDAGSRIDTEQPTFLDVFSRVMSDAIDTNQVANQDRIAIMLGETDNLEQMMLNITKAEIATDLLVTVRNSVLDAYNEIMRLQF
ncbi:MAG: flagellar hook-basal body complex protein FliE [Oscillospiraceae bacterium]|nr:flagellar hook-basal body complex protein FliE [Oscillospiraceae bacterium]